jgi:hypothetical protein
VLVAGHDEYWSTALRQHLTAAREAGVSLAFFGANDGYWHVRLQHSPLGPARVEVCYREAHLDPLALADPAATTVRWRWPPLDQPENALLGEMYAGVLQSPAPLRLAAGASPFLRGTGLQVGSVLPGLVGPEYDRVFNNDRTPAGLVILATSPIQCSAVAELCSSSANLSNATVYTARSGARVFDAGTFQWSWGLDDMRFDRQVPPHAYSTPGFQQFTANILAYLLAAPALR